MISTREAYGRTLAELGKTHDFLVLDADLSNATQTKFFAKEFPDRFMDMGIAEADMMGFASGIASCGIPVFASTFAVFASGRAYDQVRNGIAYPHTNVKIGATHGGILIGEDGGSHQSVEDIALMRVIPGMVVLVPADAKETEAVVKAALEYDGPVYMRFGRQGVPDVYTEDVDFTIGKGKVLKDGDDVTIMAIGEMVWRALEAAELLKADGISAAVLDMASVKPIDRDLILEYAKKTGHIVTAEDHNVMGGFGSAVSEVLSKNLPTPMAMVGSQDQFGQSGTPADLAKAYGLTAENIAKNAKEVLQK